MDLAQLCIFHGGSLQPLLVSLGPEYGPSLTNPSILVDNKDNIIINLRNLNYVLYHSEQGKYEHIWGPLCYLHEENNQRLVTHNVICNLDSNLNIIGNSVIDTSFCDETPIWEFVGLEDGRLVEWNNKLYLSGVRRDTTSNGIGRMELSELQFKNNKVLETKRTRIPAPPPDSSYCEKNWMPILDKPYCYVKWTNPTEVVEFNIHECSTKTIKIGDAKNLNCGDLRGGSQVIPFGEYYLALVHEADLYNSEAGRKNATYKHRFVLWDKEFNLIEISDKFSFMGAKVEFCCGIAAYNDNLLITYGFQDNAAYLLSMPKTLLQHYLKNI